MAAAAEDQGEELVVAKRPRPVHQQFLARPVVRRELLHRTTRSRPCKKRAQRGSARCRLTSGMVATNREKMCSVGGHAVREICRRGQGCRWCLRRPDSVLQYPPRKDPYENG